MIDAKTRIIFLDIDGVLNHHGYFRTAKDKNERDPIDPENVKALNKIIENTGAKVVISSTWRMFYDHKAIQRLLDAKGFEGEVIGETPDIYTEYKFNAPRGCEIDLWIKNNMESPYSYRRYVIIDDDSDMLLQHKDHLILTDFTGGGLTENAAYRATRMLQGLENIDD